MQVDELGAGLAAQLGIEVRQGLVHAEHRRLADDRASQSDTLTLTAAELTGLAVEIVAEAQRFGRRLGLDATIGLRLTAHLQRELDVGLHGLVRVQRIALEDHRHVAQLGLDIVDLGVADEDVTAGRRLQSGDHPQQCALPAAGRPEQDHEVVILDVDRHVVDGFQLAAALPERLRDVIETNLGHAPEQ